MSWLRHRAGRRGAFLVFLALLDLAYGYSFYTTAKPQRVLNLLLPWQVWGLIWIGTGVVCAAGVLARHDQVSFMLAAALKFCWALLYLNLWIHGLPRGWISASVWLAFACTVVLVAGWPDYE